jgi:iron complex outermembrane recepter protein
LRFVVLTNFLIWCSLTTVTIAEDLADLSQQLLQLSLEELMDIPIVTSVGRKEQSLYNAPAAVFVLTQRDIQRSGVTTIADALRLVPGVQVSRYNSHGWAVGIRGFNHFFSNKLLVLIDGNSVYNPVFAGVYWDSLDVLLNDIERVEVIRGPGGTMWGANAMNGVINIITKSAQDTQSSLLSVAAGNKLKYATELRYGGSTDLGYYRIYAKTRNYAGLTRQDSDEWQYSLLGARLDGNTSQHDWRLRAEAHYQTVRETPLLSEIALSSEHNNSLFLDAHTNYTSSADSVFKLEAALELHERHAADMGANTNVFRLGWQNLRSFNEYHELNWGLNYNWTQLDSYSDVVDNGFIPSKYNEYLLGMFLQHDWNIIPAKFTLTVGSKFEFTKINKIQYQPNIRALWSLSERSSLWAAVSRAVRTQSFAERFFWVERKLAAELNPFAPLDLVFISRGDTKSAESVTAYELGFNTGGEDFTLSSTVFYHDYRNLIHSVRTVVPELPQYRVVLDNRVINASEGSSHGLELSLDWYLDTNLRWQISYSMLDLDIQPFFPEAADAAWDTELNAPRHQLAFRSELDLNEHWQLDLGLRYVDNINVSAVKIPSYMQLDLRLAYQINDNLSWSVVGQNLLAKYQAEFATLTFNPLYRANERSIYTQLKWHF